jgi:hypothetical protein
MSVCVRPSDGLFGSTHGCFGVLDGFYFCFFSGAEGEGEGAAGQTLERSSSLV